MEQIAIAQVVKDDLFVLRCGESGLECLDEGCRDWVIYISDNDSIMFEQAFEKVLDCHISLVWKCGCVDPVYWEECAVDEDDRAISTVVEDINDFCCGVKLLDSADVINSGFGEGMFSLCEQRPAFYSFDCLCDIQWELITQRVGKGVCLNEGIADWIFLGWDDVATIDTGDSIRLVVFYGWDMGGRDRE